VACWSNFRRICTEQAHYDVSEERLQCLLKMGRARHVSVHRSDLNQEDIHSHHKGLGSATEWTIVPIRCPKINRYQHAVTLHRHRFQPMSIFQISKLGYYPKIQIFASPAAEQSRSAAKRTLCGGTATSRHFPTFNHSHAPVSPGSRHRDMRFAQKAMRAVACEGQTVNRLQVSHLP
jgi:hypothetical protein